MSKATTAPVSDHAGPVPAAGDGVPELGNVLATGATYFGEPVTEIVIRWAGGELKASLRPPGADELSDLAREIEAALGETPDDWVLGEEVCRRIGGGVTVGRSFYRAVRELKEMGRVESNTQRGIRLKS